MSLLRRFFSVRLPLQPALLRCFSVGQPQTGVIGESLEKKRARLLYQSRYRGILECDIVLGGFAETELKKLDAEGLKEFDELINGDHNEWDIWYWVAGAKKIPDEFNSATLRKVIDFAWSNKKIFPHQKIQSK